MVTLQADANLPKQRPHEILMACNGSLSPSNAEMLRLLVERAKSARQQKRERVTISVTESFVSQLRWLFVLYLRDNCSSPAGHNSPLRTTYGWHYVTWFLWVKQGGELTTRSTVSKNSNFIPSQVRTMGSHSLMSALFPWLLRTPCFSERLSNEG